MEVDLSKKIITGPFHWIYEGDSKENIEFSKYKNKILSGIRRSMDTSAPGLYHVTRLWSLIYKAECKFDIYVIWLIFQKAMSRKDIRNPYDIAKIKKELVPIIKESVPII